MDREQANRRFREVVLPHLDDALSLARWLTGSRHDAEDVVQDACIRALDGLDGFAGGSARAWLLKIVRNTSFTWMARNRPKGLIVTDDEALFERGRADAAAGQPVPTPEAALIEKADASALEAAIAALPAPFRETLVLRDLNGLGYREIGDITGVPIGTVMSRLSRARTYLMQRIGDPSAPADRQR